MSTYTYLLVDRISRGRTGPKPGRWGGKRLTIGYSNIDPYAILSVFSLDRTHHAPIEPLEHRLELAIANVRRSVAPESGEPTRYRSSDARATVCRSHCPTNYRSSVSRTRIWSPRTVTRLDFTSSGGLASPRPPLLAKLSIKRPRPSLRSVRANRLAIARRNRGRESGRRAPSPESGPSPRRVRPSPGLCPRRCAGPGPSRP